MKRRITLFGSHDYQRMLLYLIVRPGQCHIKADLNIKEYSFYYPKYALNPFSSEALKRQTALRFEGQFSEFDAS